MLLILFGIVHSKFSEKWNPLEKVDRKVPFYLRFFLHFAFFICHGLITVGFYNTAVLFHLWLTTIQLHIFRLLVNGA